MKRRLSFFTFLFLGNIVLVGIIILIAGMFSWHHLDSEYQKTRESNQERLVEVSRRYFEDTWPAKTPVIDDINPLCRSLVPDPDIRLTVIYKDGVVLGDSWADPASMENHKTEDRPEIMTALKRGNLGRHIRTSETLNIEFRYFALPVRINNNIEAVVRIAMPMRVIAEGSGLIRSALLWSALLAIVSAIILALILSWIWYSPLRQITRAARKIASGKLDRRVAISGSSELTQLSIALNEMRSSLAEQINTIASQRKNLDTVVTNLREGVIALDGKSRVVIMNSAATRLMEIDEDDITDQPLQNLVRLPDAIDAINRTLDTGEIIRRQVQTRINETPATLELTSVPVTTQGADGIHAILVIRDITEQFRMAAVKSEFVANASHELRTPLATIRAAVDSLNATEHDDIDAFNKFVDILNRHTHRLELMTNDLLDLHLVEKDLEKLNITGISIDSLEEWVRDQFFHKAAERNIDLRVSSEGEKRPFETDEKLLRLILQNLVDNAVKFTPREGIVYCSFTLSDWNLIIRIQDTGCGIPPDLKDRVFERFFQVESSRAGDTSVRGTGLGLAIVKHSAERLGASIELSTAPGEGTTFEIRIPECE